MWHCLWGEALYASSSKEFALRGTGEFLGVLNRVIIPEMQRKTVKSYIAPWKGNQDIRGFWIPRHGFRIPGPGFLSFSVEPGLWIPIVCGIPDSLSCSLDSIA